MNYRTLISPLSGQKKYDHYVIAKTNYICRKREEASRPDNSVSAVDHKYYSVLEYAMAEENFHVSVRLTILKPVQNIADPSPEQDTIPVTKAKDARIILPEDVFSFVRDIGDSNPIHRADSPVVPGLMLLEEVLHTFGYIGEEGEILCPAAVTMSFHHPLFANIPYILHYTKRSGAGARTSTPQFCFSGNAISFERTYFSGAADISFEKGGRCNP